MANESIDAMLDLLDGKAPVQTTEPAPQPVAETIVPATPPTEQQPPNTPPAAQPATFDIDAELVKITGGAIKNKDEIAAIIERSNKVTDFENRYKNLEDENTSLKAKANTDPFANDTIKKLNELYKAGATDSQIQAFTQLNKVADLETLSPLDAKILALQLQHKLTPEEARNYVNTTYKLNPNENDEETIKSESIRLKVDAQADRNFLKNHKAEVSTAPVSEAEKQQQDLQQKATEQIAKLTPIANQVLNTISFKGMSLNGKEGDQAIKADFEVSDESKASLKPLIEKFIQTNWNGIQPNEEGAKQIEQYAKNILAIQNYPAWIINAASVRETQVRAEYHNPTPLNRGLDANRPVNTKEEFDKQLLERY